LARLPGTAGFRALYKTCGCLASSLDLVDGMGNNALFSIVLFVVVMFFVRFFVRRIMLERAKKKPTEGQGGDEG
jgi:hypothetical protein